MYIYFSASHVCVGTLYYDTRLVPEERGRGGHNSPFHSPPLRPLPLPASLSCDTLCWLTNTNAQTRCIYDANEICGKCIENADFGVRGGENYRCTWDDTVSCPRLVFQRTQAPCGGGRVQAVIYMYICLTMCCVSDPRVLLQHLRIYTYMVVPDTLPKINNTRLHTTSYDGLMTPSNITCHFVTNCMLYSVLVS